MTTATVFTPSDTTYFTIPSPYMIYPFHLCSKYCLKLASKGYVCIWSSAIGVGYSTSRGSQTSSYMFILSSLLYIWCKVQLMETLPAEIRKVLARAAQRHRDGLLVVAHTAGEVLRFTRGRGHGGHEGGQPRGRRGRRCRCRRRGCYSG